MGNALGQIFIDPTTLPAGGYGFIQLLGLTAVYGKLIFDGSCLISDGSELLLLVPSIAGVVGSVVLPVLGAVPDGAMVLFSGLGAASPAAQQKQLSVGIGALAGSTIMLLTLPWILALVAGRVTCIDGEPNYKLKLRDKSDWSMTGTGISVTPEISFNAKMMLLTCLPYVLIQAPAFAGREDLDPTIATIALVLCVAFFFLYLFLMVRNSTADGRMRQVTKKIVEQIEGGHFSFTHAVLGWMNKMEDDGVSMVGAQSNYGSALLSPSKGLKGGLGGMGSNKRTEERQFLADVLKVFFSKYDKDGNGSLDAYELRALFVDLGEKPTEAQFRALIEGSDLDRNGNLDFAEFCDAMVKFVLSKNERAAAARPRTTTGSSPVPVNPASTSVNGGEVKLGQGKASVELDEDEDSEEEDYPEDIDEELSFSQKQALVKKKAGWAMLSGTVLVLLISDPMVAVMGEIGDRVGVSPFYISFVLAPLSSNASELIASYSYALKKTKRTITISFSALLGAACMNNTFCLGIFMALMVFKGLKWQFSAETVSILLVQITMFAVGMKRVHYLKDGLIVLMLYPASLALVAALENGLGWT